MVDAAIVYGGSELELVPRAGSGGGGGEGGSSSIGQEMTTRTQRAHSS